ncbi:MAG: hypothetical protein IJ873_01365, partial [Lachnospiraceae bacterium]|nr:hypothetical protein [Lachnospiraceae bacterium]
GMVKRKLTSIRSKEMWDCFQGNLPYYVFSSQGAIPMEAYLYVEENPEERELYRSEMVQGAKEQVMSALVFSENGQASEYGSIVIQLREEGPVRTG